MEDIGITQKIYRRAKGQKQQRGVIVAVKDQAEKLIYIGFSLCRKTDKFDKNLALEIAYGRATGTLQIVVPPSINADMEKFLGRIERYYKDYTLGTEVLEASRFTGKIEGKWKDL